MAKNSDPFSGGFTEKAFSAAEAKMPANTEGHAGYGGDFHTGRIRPPKVNAAKPMGGAAADRLGALADQIQSTPFGAAKPAKNPIGAALSPGRRASVEKAAQASVGARRARAKGKLGI